ncbi:XRE family transcriptional regulator [Azospirillum brasilense]|uniref:XRE family transcriptional regulator n=1 Tax=Azospirillum brasilense TaxID=192 RepID=UPI0003A8C478|nr:XRE family transcriptional regulator [Azospirillum brasilense]MDW7595184.1 XRE family transcriptional regulator [Azospirillum brasilense]
MLGWNLKVLAEKSGVAWATVQRMQNGDGVPTQSAKRVAAVQKAFEEAGVRFIGEKGVTLDE